MEKAVEPGPPIYPLSLRLAGRRVVVVGGGAVALRRVAGLRAAGADVLVVAPELSPALADLAARGLITARTGEYEPADLSGAWLVMACTDQPHVNAAVASDAERQRMWCVRADDAAASAAWVPAVGRAAGATVAVNAGRDPRRAAALRDRLMTAVTETSRTDAADARDRAAGSPGTVAHPPAPAGRVSIVGGGPGDPDLITVAGLRRLREADVVVADRLAPLELLEGLAQDTVVIDAAKVPGGPAMRQDTINETLVAHARAGRAVVRFKGGDPFVFGRGREEVDACLAAGVPVEVVPGVTSAIAVPAAAGVPVTHRGLSQGFCVITGHVSPAGTGRAAHWAALARSGLTLVLLMSIEHLASITHALLAAGLPGTTPCACVSDGWSRQQRVVTGTLDRIADAVAKAGAANPAVIVVGEVAGFAAGDPAWPAPSSPGEAPRQAGPPPPPTTATATARRVLVLGGARSGKSAAAEQMLAGYPAVDYLATGAPPGLGDGDWDDRVGEHRRRRPPHWRTVETLAVADALVPQPAPTEAPALPAAAAEPQPAPTAEPQPVPPGPEPSPPPPTAEPQPLPPGPEPSPLPPAAEPQPAPAGGPQHPGAAPPQPPLLVDCVSTWLARVMDECGAWTDDPGSADALASRVDGLVSAWEQSGRHVVAVSSEVGLGVIPASPSGRRFRDELGKLNARLAQASDEVWFCTAGIARRLR
jgi:uroporphyrin-III C-methyltransferase / precorrin-2 dehydrogenase / sirohydrochlorin ferrochelatase